jgi:hypothetical protein
MQLNKRGDRRGMNGRGAVRGPNGKFTSEKTTATTDPTGPTAPFERLNKTRAKRRDNRDRDPTFELFAGLQVDDSDPFAPRMGDLAGALPPLTAVPHLPEVGDTLLDDLLDSVFEGGDDQPRPPQLPQLEPAEPPEPPTEPPTEPELSEPTQPPEPVEPAQSFEEATSGASLERLKRITGMTDAKPKAQGLYRDWLTLQCCRDRADTGVCALHVVETDVLLPSMATLISFSQASNVSIQTVAVADITTTKAISRIFVARDIMSGGDKLIAHDMDLFTREPFYTLAATRNGEVVGGCVFRAHSLNNGERMIQIELIATKEGGAVGVGTCLMRVLRGLSQASAMHTGHIAALTLKSKSASRFYARKLPEAGPMARALLLSTAMLDPLMSMPKHLELRSVTVRPIPV